MKLHTKALVGVLPLLLLPLIVLEGWTIRTTSRSIEESTFLHMHVTLDSYVANTLYSLLQHNDLEAGDAFIKDAEAASALILEEAGQIFALDDAGKLVFCRRDDVPCRELESIWSNVAVTMGRKHSKDLVQGHIHTDFGGYVYVAKYVVPVKWSIFYMTPDRVLHEGQQAIRNRTMLFTGLCSAVSFFLIPFVFRRIFVEPIIRLQQAAGAITREESIEHIAVDSNDELGHLSRDMERMAQAIQEHHRQQRHWQEQLEQQVRTQTADLHKEIEERKKAEESLRRERNLVSHIMETSPVGITTVDKNGHLTFANSRAEEILGLTKDKITQRDYNAPEWKITGYDGQPFPEEQLPFMRILRGKTTVMGVRHAIEWPDGRRILLVINAAPLFDGADSLIGMVAIVDDVSEQVAALKALRASEAKFHSLYSSMNEGVVLHELLTDDSGKALDYRILDANPMYETFTGVRRDEAVGKLGSEVYGVSPAPYLARFAQVAQSGHSSSFETYFAPFDRHYRISVFSPEPGKFATVFSDISEQKRIEEQIRKLNTELEQRVAERTAELEMTNRELRHFIYAASHDLKTPLQGIGHLAYWLGEDYAEAYDDKGKELISMLLKRTKRLNLMLDGILEYSSVGRDKIRNVELPLSNLIHTLIQELEPPASLRIIIEDDLPVVTTCREYLGQVFQHLLKNAIIFMGNEEGEICVRCLDRQEYWQFSVSDTGPGIDPKYHEKVFQIFQTLQSRDEIESCGIGLALVKKIVEACGGKVWLESQLGEGSTFFFTLPK